MAMCTQESINAIVQNDYNVTMMRCKSKRWGLRKAEIKMTEIHCWCCWTGLRARQAMCDTQIGRSEVHFQEVTYHFFHSPCIFYTFCWCSLCIRSLCAIVNAQFCDPATLIPQRISLNGFFAAYQSPANTKQTRIAHTLLHCAAVLIAAAASIIHLMVHQTNMFISSVSVD